MMDGLPGLLQGQINPFFTGYSIAEGMSQLDPGPIH
jgi:hypothetical protein